MADLALKVAATVFIFVAVLHAARVMLKMNVKIGKFVVPLWMSVVGIIVALSLAWFMLKAV